MAAQKLPLFSGCLCVGFILISPASDRISLPCVLCSSAPQRPHVNREIQPPQHDEAEHQSINPSLPESGQDAGLGVPSPAAVLCRPGALPQTWTER